MAQALKCQIAHPALGLLRGTNFGGHGVAILASKQSAPGGHFGSVVSCFDAVSCLVRHMTVALPCLGLDSMGNGLKEIRWDGSRVSLAYDTDTQSIPALLAAHDKDVAAKFCIGPVVVNLELSWAHSCQTLP